MTGLLQVEWEKCFVEPQRNPELERAVKDTVGFSMPVTRYFNACPWLVHSFIQLHPNQFGLVYTSLRFSELITLVVSQDNACRFCYATTRTSLRLMGVPKKRIEELERDLSTADLSAAEKAALEFSRRLSRANPLPCSDDWNVLRQTGLEDPAIKEIAFIAASTVYFNRIMTLPAVPIEAVEKVEERWRFRLLLPLLARKLRAHQHRSKLEPRPAPTTGPYSYLVAALDRLPAAEVLHGVLEEAWESPILPKRTKAMVLAVVGRGLGCTLGEEEAVRLLLEEGLDANDVQEILARLASPKLDELESAIVPFARETIWYRPAQIQRRGRDLRARLTNEQFLELVGVAALANALCRLSVILDSPGP
jgi:AhpD family alkylhydroperoxidase